MIQNFHSFPTIDLCDENEVTYAVRVENVTFAYNNRATVLKSLTVRIAQGGIFALLGSNGCGKTTLLKLILGRAKPKTGWIRVFGLEPGHKQSDIPGPGVGYMPQDIALFSELTIKQCLRYYGNVYKINETSIEHRIQLLKDLLLLPDLDSRLDLLSGGQKRLVSMAVTIIHRPKLLILDEPTVGVDSMLRCRIWSYLENICKHYATTVLITTHYIEEAKNAQNVGFIRTGTLLKQSNPHQLIEEFDCKTLEEVFLTLCQQQHHRLREKRKSSFFEISEEICPPEPENKLLVDIELTNANSTGIDFRRLSALLKKSLIRLKRSLFSLLLFLIVPLITITIYKQTVGTSPRNMPIAIYTGEEMSTKIMAQKLLDEFLPEQIRYQFYPTEKAAINSVITGKDMYAFIYPVNYSQSLTQRIPAPFDAGDQVINNSIIRIYADHSNSIAAIFVRYTYIIDSVLRFLMKVGSELGLKPSLFSRPIDVSDPIFVGSFLHSETYPSAGIVMIVVYLMAIAFSSMFIIKDLKSQSLERTYVSGVKPIEVMIVHLIEMFVLTAIQSFLVTILMYFLFDIPLDYIGFQSFLLILLHGIEGVGIGLLIALVFKDEIFIFIIIVGIMMPLMTVSGVIWPIEAIPMELRLLIDWLPITQPLDSLRSLLFRRLTISEPRVSIGFIICLVYNLLIYSANFILVTLLKDFDFANFFHLGFRS